MFALMNPPIGKHRKGRKTAKNSWFGNSAGHRAAAKKGWAGRRKKHGKKIKHASELRTPGGGRIFGVAANPKPFWPKIRHNNFMGVNPHISPSTSTRSHTMARKRRTRFNLGFSSPKRSGSIFDAFKPNNLVGVTPILAGVIIDGLVTKMLSDKIPYTKKGIGNIALGLASAGVLGMAAKYANKQLGDGIFVGGVVGTLGCAFQSFMTDGIKSLTLGNWSNEGLSNWSSDGMSGMGTFVSPQQIASAIPSGGTMSQYALPAANAQFVPQLAPPQTPMQHSQVQGMSDNDMGAIGAVLGQDGESMGM